MNANKKVSLAGGTSPGTLIRCAVCTHTAYYKGGARLDVRKEDDTSTRVFVCNECAIEIDKYVRNQEPLNI